MKRISLLASALILNGCVSFDAIDMASQPTEQKYDLTDSEGDGVIDARDNCPETTLGAAVDNNGCGLDVIEKMRVTLLVNFDNDSAEVAPKYYSDIKQLADLMKEYSSVNVTIEGHTSKIGTAEYNLKLSLKRAEAVKTLLVNQYNVKATRIDVIGYGFERLLFEGNDEYANSQNRRIVAEIAGGKEVTEMKWNIYSVDK